MQPLQFAREGELNDLDRHQKIESLLSDRPFISVNDLVEMLGVSPATIRRDIDRLSKSLRGQKVYGGIAATGALRQRPIALPFSDNRDIAVDAKRAIAKTAARLVRDGSIVIIHAGSTCFHFGLEVGDRNIRVVTHSIPLAAYLAEKGKCQLTVGGGDLHREPGVLYDHSSAQANVFASQFYVGALGVDQRGILESHPLLVRMVKDFADRANDIILLVDSRKFDERPPVSALPLGRISQIVTDDGLSDVHARMLDDEGVKYTIASKEAVS